jgi:hypothetical protein
VFKAVSTWKNYLYYCVTAKLKIIHLLLCWFIDIVNALQRESYAHLRVDVQLAKIDQTTTWSEKRLSGRFWTETRTLSTLNTGPLLRQVSRPCHHSQLLLTRMVVDVVNLYA